MVVFIFVLKNNTRVIRIHNGTVSPKSGKIVHLSVLECDNCSFFMSYGVSLIQRMNWI